MKLFNGIKLISNLKKEKEKKQIGLNTASLLRDEWISIKSWGNGWSGRVLYINPALEKAKVYDYEITHWGYHDECDKDESEEFVNIEEALEMVYPDETAVSLILDNSSKDYSVVIKEIKSRTNQ